MAVVDANWRGIGVVPQSGYALRPEYAAHDARVRFPSYRDLARKRAGQMPPGCDCAQVVLGTHPAERMPAVRRRLHAAPSHRPVHGLRRRRLSHLVGERRARAGTAGPARGRSRLSVHSV